MDDTIISQTAFYSRPKAEEILKVNQRDVTLQPAHALCSEKDADVFLYS